LEEEGTAVGTLLCNPTAILDERRRPSDHRHESAKPLE
jgi:hypothetical protein